MTDQQFQPGQPTPPTQGGGVFGGQPEEIAYDPTVLGSFDQPKTPVAEEPKAAPFGGVSEFASSPFEGYTIPQNDTVEEAPVIEEPIEEKVIEPEVNLPIETPSEEVVEEGPITEEPVVEIPAVEETPVEEPTQEPLSDIQQKFTELTENISDLTSLLKLKDGEVLEIVGANNDKVSLLYQFGINEQDEIHVKRIETDKSDDETTFNELTLGVNSESHFLEVFVDEVLLFQEDDLLEDTKKKSQVMDKLNKFIFLTESKLKDVQKELRAKQEEEEERRRLQDIFRNF